MLTAASLAIAACNNEKSNGSEAESVNTEQETGTQPTEDGNMNPDVDTSSSTDEEMTEFRDSILDALGIKQ